MDNPTTGRGHTLAIGFLAGAAVGAGLTMWLAPRAASELRQRVTDAAKGLRQRATDRCEEASARVDEAMDELTKKGQAVRDEAAETLARGARDVEGRGTASERVPG